MNLAAMIEQGSFNPWVLFSTALILGALHGLEPGHSKTLMAAFIIAVRGTVYQAVLLGTAAAFSHSIIVWVLALMALAYGDEIVSEELEPWFVMLSGGIVIAIAAWSWWQTWRARAGSQQHVHPHSEPAVHSNHHAHSHAHEHLSPDAHAHAHAQSIEQQFSAGRASHAQVLWFGLTGGLIPCPAAVTVLLVCLHLQQFWLGVGLVGSFSIGLALTLVMVGVAAAWGVSAASRKTSRFDALFAKTPYLSAMLIATIGIVLLVSGAIRVK